MKAPGIFAGGLLFYHDLSLVFLVSLIRLYVIAKALIVVFISFSL